MKTEVKEALKTLYFEETEELPLKSELRKEYISSAKKVSLSLDVRFPKWYDTIFVTFCKQLD